MRAMILESSSPRPSLRRGDGGSCGARRGCFLAGSPASAGESPGAAAMLAADFSESEHSSLDSSELSEQVEDPVSVLESDGSAGDDPSDETCPGAAGAGGPGCRGLPALRLIHADQRTRAAHAARSPEIVLNTSMGIAR